MTVDGSQPQGSPPRLSANALERRVKRWLAGGPFDCFVQVAPGLEPILADELLDLGLAPGRGGLHLARGGIGLALDHEGIMRANLHLRTAGRVMLRLGTFPAGSREMLYDRARKIAWEVQLGFAAGYRLRVTAKNSKLQAGDEVTDAVAGAVSRRMREVGLYPKPSEDAPLEFHVRLLDDRCTISLNTSGEHLHRRGVRTHVHTAPVRETLAAALALTGLASTPEPPELIVDPFCGSGTILLEAADLLASQPPGRRRGFAFQHVAWFREGRWREVQRQAAAGAPPTAPTRLLGIDSDPRALDAARANLAASGYLATAANPAAGGRIEPAANPAPSRHRVELVEGDSTTFAFEGLGARRGLVLGNPPYGVRLGDKRGAADIVRRLLERLAAGRTAWQLVLLVHDPDAVTEHQAFEVSSVTATSNGGVPVVMVAGRVRPSA